MEAQSRLIRGADGTDKPLSCSASVLAKLADKRPDCLNGIERILGDKKAQRFGAAFLDVIAEHQ
jgi:ATP-dependent DNA helicase RecQ